MVDAIRERGKVEVKALACPQCGGSIHGSGSCPNCNQLLLVTREYGVLKVSDEDIKGWEIKPPSEEKKKSDKDPTWEFKGAGTIFCYDQSRLTILGGGNPEVGARLVAMFYVDHPEDALPGREVAKWRDIEDYSISKVLQGQ
jgi:hypothetical protein